MKLFRRDKVGKETVDEYGDKPEWDTQGLSKDALSRIMFGPDWTEYTKPENIVSEFLPSTQGA